MSQFKINIKKCRSEISNLKAIENLLIKLQGQINDAAAIIAQLDGCHEVASALTKIKEDVYTETNNVGQLRDVLEQTLRYYKEADKAKDISFAVVKLNGSSNIPIDQFSKTDNVLEKELEKLLKFIDDLKQTLDSINTSKFCESTKDFLKVQEGIWRTVVKTKRPDGTIVYSIGHGNDFTEESNPDLYEKYVINGEEITSEDADRYLDERIAEFGDALDNFIAENNLKFTQNQYDSLYSYFYNNGPYVFTDDVYNKWVSRGGEYEARAEARKKLEDYLISANGNYDSDLIAEYFVNSKGPSMNHEYVGRRTAEADLFNTPE